MSKSSYVLFEFFGSIKVPKKNESQEYFLCLSPSVRFKKRPSPNQHSPYKRFHHKIIFLAHVHRSPLVSVLKILVQKEARASFTHSSNENKVV